MCLGGEQSSELKFRVLKFWCLTKDSDDKLVWQKHAASAFLLYRKSHNWIPFPRGGERCATLISHTDYIGSGSTPRIARPLGCIHSPSSFDWMDMESMAGPSHDPSRLLRKLRSLRGQPRFVATACQPKRRTPWIAGVVRFPNTREKLHDCELTGACGFRRRWTSKSGPAPCTPATPPHCIGFSAVKLRGHVRGDPSKASSGHADWSPSLPEPVRHARTGHLRNGRCMGPRRWTRTLLYRGPDAILSAASAGNVKVVVQKVLIPPTWRYGVASERRTPSNTGPRPEIRQHDESYCCVYLRRYLVSALPMLQLRLSRPDSWPAASWLASRWCAGGPAVGASLTCHWTD